jgi:hypothetical protein
MQNLNEAKQSAAKYLKFLEKSGDDGKSVKPLLEDINIKLGRIKDRIKRVGMSEDILVSKVEKLFNQTIANVEQEQDIKLLDLTHRLTAPYLPITKV